MTGPPDARPGCTPATPIAPAAGAGHKLPAGARAEHSAAPAGYQGEDARAKWKAALAAHNAAKRRGRFTRAAKKTGPGMIRRPPPEPQGDDAA